MRTDSCRDCQFWDKLEIKGELMGICRRYPPVSDPGHIPKQPIVRSDDWCGEWIFENDYTVSGEADIS